MTAAGTAPLLGGLALFERAVTYLLGNLVLVTPRLMSSPTPCPKWTVRALLDHLNDTMAAIEEAGTGHIRLDSPHTPTADPARLLRARAGRALGAWTTVQTPQPITIADHTLTPTLLLTTVALEVTTHGWDLAAACGTPRPIPAMLADDLLTVAPLLVTTADRPTRFAAATIPTPDAPPAERLLAFLGRSVCRYRHRPG
jgi:uncharacterized protein (TIGR03086 family)